MEITEKSSGISRWTLPLMKSKAVVALLTTLQLVLCLCSSCLAEKLVLNSIVQGDELIIPVRNMRHGLIYFDPKKLEEDKMGIAAQADFHRAFLLYPGNVYNNTPVGDIFAVRQLSDTIYFIVWLKEKKEIAFVMVAKRNILEVKKTAEMPTKVPKVLLCKIVAEKEKEEDKALKYKGRFYFANRDNNRLAFFEIENEGKAAPKFAPTPLPLPSGVPIDKVEFVLSENLISPYEVGCFRKNPFRVLQLNQTDQYMDLSAELERSEALKRGSEFKTEVITVQSIGYYYWTLYIGFSVGSPDEMSKGKGQLKIYMCGIQGTQNTTKSITKCKKVFDQPKRHQESFMGLHHYHRYEWPTNMNYSLVVTFGKWSESQKVTSSRSLRVNFTGANESDIFVVKDIEPPETHIDNNFLPSNPYPYKTEWKSMSVAKVESPTGQEKYSYHQAFVQQGMTDPYKLIYDSSIVKMVPFYFRVRGNYLLALTKNGTLKLLRENDYTMLHLYTNDHKEDQIKIPALRMHEREYKWSPIDLSDHLKLNYNVSNKVNSVSEIQTFQVGSFAKISPERLVRGPLQTVDIDPSSRNLFEKALKLNVNELHYFMVNKNFSDPKPLSKNMTFGTTKYLFSLGDMTFYHTCSKVVSDNISIYCTESVPIRWGTFLEIRKIKVALDTIAILSKNPKRPGRAYFYVFNTRTFMQANTSFWENDTSTIDFLVHENYFVINIIRADNNGSRSVIYSMEPDELAHCGDWFQRSYGIQSFTTSPGSRNSGLFLIGEMGIDLWHLNKGIPKETYQKLFTFTGFRRIHQFAQGKVKLACMTDYAERKGFKNFVYSDGKRLFFTWEYDSWRNPIIGYSVLVDQIDDLICLDSQAILVQSKNTFTLIENSLNFVKDRFENVKYYELPKDVSIHSVYTEGRSETREVIVATRNSNNHSQIYLLEPKGTQFLLQAKDSFDKPQDVKINFKGAHSDSVSTVFKVQPPYKHPESDIAWRDLFGRSEIKDNDTHIIDFDLDKSPLTKHFLYFNMEPKEGFKIKNRFESPEEFVPKEFADKKGVILDLQTFKKYKLYIFLERAVVNKTDLPILYIQDTSNTSASKPFLASFNLTASVASFRSHRFLSVNDIGLESNQLLNIVISLASSLTSAPTILRLHLMNDSKVTNETAKEDIVRRGEIVEYYEWRRGTNFREHIAIHTPMNSTLTVFADYLFVSIPSISAFAAVPNDKNLVVVLKDPSQSTISMKYIWVNDTNKWKYKLQTKDVTPNDLPKCSEVEKIICRDYDFKKGPGSVKADTVSPHMYCLFLGSKSSYHQFSVSNTSKTVTSSKVFLYPPLGHRHFGQVVEGEGWGGFVIEMDKEKYGGHEEENQAPQVNQASHSRILADEKANDTNNTNTSNTSNNTNNTNATNGTNITREQGYGKAGVGFMFLAFVDTEGEGKKEIAAGAQGGIDMKELFKAGIIGEYVARPCTSPKKICFLREGKNPISFNLETPKIEGIATKARHSAKVEVWGFNYLRTSLGEALKDRFPDKIDPSTEGGKGSGSSAWIIIIVVLLLLILLAVGGYFGYMYWKKRKGATSPSSSVHSPTLSIGLPEGDGNMSIDGDLQEPLTNQVPSPENENTGDNDSYKEAESSDESANSIDNAL